MSFWPRPMTPLGSCGSLKRSRPRLDQRVDRDDRRAGLLGLREGGHHAGVVGRRVMADQEDHLGLLEILDLHRALADADGGGERGAGAFVAHVRAVRHVVGAEMTREDGVEEGRLVAGAAGGVEDRLVGAGEAAQFVGDHLVGVIPGDRLVVVGALAPDHGLGQAALLAEPVLIAVGKIDDGVPREELGPALPGVGLPGDGLGAVFAELGQLAVLVRLGPRAAHAIDAVGMIQRDQGAAAAEKGLVHGQVLHGADHGGHAGGVGLRLGQADWAKIVRELGLDRMRNPAGLLVLVGGGAIGGQRIVADTLLGMDVALDRFPARRGVGVHSFFGLVLAVGMVVLRGGIVLKRRGSGGLSRIGCCHAVLQVTSPFRVGKTKADETAKCHRAARARAIQSSSALSSRAAAES